MRTTSLTCLALVAFAANSVLCRAALEDFRIDAASFSSIRLVAGALALLLLCRVRKEPAAVVAGDWSGAGLLTLYAVPFSFAYNTLATGTGALILFGAVQGTMLVAAVFTGERPRLVQWVGWIAAIAGVVYLVSPGVSAPDPLGLGLMTLAGIAWGLYSLRGRSSQDPLSETAGNFQRSIPFVLAVSVGTISSFHWTPSGVLLAVSSGALASGVGYTFWYSALPSLTATAAATVQLLVPVLAASAGVVFLGEDVTLRLLLSATMILGGVGLALKVRGS